MPAKKPVLRKQSTERSTPITCYIHYSPRDGEHYAKALVNILRIRGINTFFDLTEIRTGWIWLEALSRIREANLVIFIGTPGALRSEDALELLEAFTHRSVIRIFPIIFHDPTLLSHAVINTKFFIDMQWFLEDESALRDGPSNMVVESLLSAFEHFRASTPSIATLKTPRPQRAKKRPLNEGKLILVGRGEVGKTSLVRRLVDNKFRGDESKTQGINITTWPLRCRSNTVRLNIWDFGGQEIMHATHLTTTDRRGTRATVEEWRRSSSGKPHGQSGKGRVAVGWVSPWQFLAVA